MGGADPYSCSKGCAELVTAAYRRSFFADDGGAGVASARAGNVIGGGDWAEDRLLPDIVRGATQRTKRYDPQSRRRRAPGSTCWSRCPATCCWPSALCEEPARYAEGYNFGPAPKACATVGEVSERFVAALGRGKPVDAARADASAPARGALSRARLQQGARRARLAAAPRSRRDAGMTAAWYRAHLESPGSEREHARPAD